MHFFYSVILAVMASSAFVSAAVSGQDQGNTLDTQAAACDVYKYSACGVCKLASIIPMAVVGLTDGCDVVEYRPAVVVLARSPEWVNSKSFSSFSSSSCPSLISILLTK